MSAEHWEGVWSRPGADGQQAGTFTRDDDGSMTLRLPGGGLIEYEADPARGALVPLVHRRSEVKPVTLIDSFPGPTSTSAGDDEILNQSISPMRALVGMHLETLDAAEFRALTLHIENAHPWTRLLHAGQPAARILELAEDKSLTATADGFTVHAYETSRRRWKRGDRDKEIDTNQRWVIFHIRSNDGLVPFDGFDEIVGALRDLVTLGADQPCDVLATTLDHRSNVRTWTGEEIPDYATKVPMFDLARKSPASSALPAHYDYPFTCEDVRFSEVVPAWMDLRSRARSAIDLLLGLSYAPTPYMELQLLQTAIAAEAMHQALYEEERMDGNEFDEWMTNLLSVTAAERHAWVKGTIRNGMNYRNRLKALADKPDQDAVNALIPDRSKWLQRMVAGRNGLAHSANQRLSNQDALSDTVATQYLLKLVLMAELGVSAERQQHLARDGRTQRFVYQRQSELPG